MSRSSFPMGLWVAFLPQVLTAVELRVPADHPTIQSAIDAAAEGDSVVVASGQYPIEEPLTFRGKSIAVISEAGASSTTIRMVGRSDRSSVVIFDAGETDDGVLRGFTITGGTGTLFGSFLGGGILCLEGTRPTLEDLVIVENRATYGGALYCRQSSPTLIGCVLSRNKVTCGGGAFCDASSPRFISCTISGNRGYYASSGIHSKNGSTPYLENCWIVGNSTYYGGGVDSFESEPTLVNCVIAGNRAVMGGAAYSAAGSIRLIHCTVAGNMATAGCGGIEGGGAGTILESCILSRNNPSSTNYRAMDCLVNEDPGFVDPGAFMFDRFVTVWIAGEPAELPDFVFRWPDFHLRPGSPALDRAAPNALISSDLEGIPRPCGAAADLGAFETCLPPTSFLRGDVTVDGKVDLSDPIEILGSLFLKEPAGLPCEGAADADDDGLLDISDAVGILGSLFLGNPGPSFPFPECGYDPTADGLGCGMSACKTSE